MNPRPSSRVSKTLAFSSVAVVALGTSCADDETSEPSLAIPLGAVSFVDVTDEAGLDAPHGWSAEATAQAGPLAALLTLVGGAALGDVDGDHYDDVLLLGGDEGARFYFNAGDGSFDEATELVELDLDPFSTAPLLVDVDADQYPDLLVANVLTGAVELWRNLEGERFEREAKAFGEAAYGANGALAPATGLAVADVDFDGDLDIFVARWNVFEDDESRAGLLWVNDGNGRFSDASGAITETLGSVGCEKMLGAYLSPAFANVYGNRDLVLARQDGRSVILENVTNDAGLGFEDRKIKEDAGAPRMLGSAYGQLFYSDSYWSQFGIDGVRIDGLLSDESTALPPEAYENERLVISVDAGLCRPPKSDDPLQEESAGATLDAGADAGTGIASESNSLSVEFQDAVNRISRLANPKQPLSLGAGPALGGCSADFDNNGLLDQLQVMVSARTGHTEGTDTNGVRLWLASTDEQRFSVDDYAEATDLVSSADGRSALCFDYDSDGDVDVLLTSQGGAAQLFRNDVVSPTQKESRFIGVRIEPSADLPIPIGAIVGISTSRGRNASIALQVNSGFLAQAPMQAHFGLLEDEAVDTLWIAWPDGAPSSAFDNVLANDIYRIKRTASTAQ